MKFLSFGESLLRLRPQGHERFFQSNLMEATFGGSEANVAVSLANFGADSAYVTVLPEGPAADGCIRTLRGLGVDVSGIRRGEGRMGIYFVENGAGQLPSRVTYDRAYSAFSLAGPGAIDWEKAAEGCGWLHLSGISPAVSESAMELTFEAAKFARQKGMTVSLDLNYRKNLWNYGRDAGEVLRELTGLSDLLIANDEHIRRILSVDCPGDFDAFYPEPETYQRLCAATLSAFPKLRAVAVSLRRTHSADWNDIAGYFMDGSGFYTSKRYEIRNIVDRIGSGDSFTAGLIFGLNEWEDRRRALEFAVASACLKHSIPGDMNRVGRNEVEKLAFDGGDGRVER